MLRKKKLKMNEKIDEKQQSFVSHLTELRTRLIRSFIFLLGTFVFCYFFSKELYTKSIPDPSSPIGTEVKAREIKIYSSDPNSVSKSGSDVKWQARMSGKAGTGPSPSKLSEGSRNSRTGPGFNPLKEMERMRQEFQTLVAEKEEEIEAKQEEAEHKHGRPW